MSEATTVPDSRVGHAVWLTVLLGGATVLSAATMYLLPLACSSSCDADLAASAIQVFYWAAALVLVSVMIGVFLLRHRGWWVIAAPVAGMGALGVAFVIAYSLATLPVVT
ncbi:hypothetical protein [Microbacterium sp. NPDC064584]|uniref:hypothetical protein n=1 Tax=Microbacterium sp. NPDC064584 TaxID=3155817 RepID=UPI003433462C